MFDNAWMKRWQDAVNNNGPMSWIGKHFTADMLLGFGDKQFVVNFVKGKIASFTDEIGPETCDQMVMWQNMRAFTWALDRMREV